MSRHRRMGAVIGASLLAHAVLLWGSATMLRPAQSKASAIVYAVDLPASRRAKAVQKAPPWIAQRQPTPRLGDRLPPWARGAADSLERRRAAGTETGSGKPQRRRALVAGADLADLQERTYNHPTRNSPQRIRTARRAVTHDNRRATPNPGRSTHLVSGRGDSQRRARQRARHSAAGPRAAVGAQAKRLGGRVAPEEKGSLASRRGEASKKRAVSRLLPQPRVGDRAPAQRRPEVRRHLPASETRHKRQDVADDRNRRQASSRRRPSLLDMAQASGRGERRGRGRGSTAGRRGAPEGRRRGAAIYLNTRDRRYVAYFRKIHRKIQPLWRFPKSLEIQMEQGDVLVEFTLRADGTLAKLGIRRGSGYRAFDNNALRAVRKAAPYPAIPRGLGAPLTILAPFEFSNPLIR